MSFRSPSSRQLPRPMALGNGTEHENLYSWYLHLYFSQCDRLSWFCLYTFVFLIICHTFLASLRYFNFPSLRYLRAQASLYFQIPLSNIQNVLGLLLYILFQAPLFYNGISQIFKIFPLFQLQYFHAQISLHFQIPLFKIVGRGRAWAQSTQYWTKLSAFPLMEPLNRFNINIWIQTGEF